MLVYKEYNRARAVEYARTWALLRNPLFIDFTGRGGDCTNFVSQCIYAGSCQMNFTPNFGWYFITSDNRAPAWTSVEYFYDFMTNAPQFVTQNDGIGPYGFETTADRVFEGDVVQLQNSNGIFYHTLIITGFRNGQTLVSAHSNDAQDKPLGEYTYANLRYIHIEGVRIEVEDDLCFEGLINGTDIGFPR